MTGQAGVQTGVSTVPAVAVAGDFASVNPKWSAIGGPGALVAGASGCVVGVFAWTTPPLDPDGTPSLANNFGQGPVVGFVHREQQALITAFLGYASMAVPAGYPVTLMTGGDFWVVNSGSSEAQIGQKAYANLTTGAVTFAATGSASTGATGTASSIAASTSSFTGSIGGNQGNVLTVTAVSSGTIYAGTTISGTNVATGTQVQSQLTPLLTGESLGGIGRYYVSIPEQTVASTTISGTYGTLTVGGTVTGTFTLGGLLSGTGVAAGTHITAFISGAGGAGTYAVDNNTVVNSTSISETGNVETKWIAMSAGANGELVKISDHAQG